ncbi:MAG: hypothetical protein JKY62_05130 [Desulfocapsa sp.]|uniref:PpiC domain-containing protein n=1 Tax=Desulfotalea psychrophila TaxID=84980 RepID=A0ABS3AWT7_9BACT|nr:hypothetical protein [Desulfocapsa sp.]MBN4068471.1 hypothetical protein [Desulfotalea psychrophila]
MKYLLIILSIVIFSSMVSFYYLLPPEPMSVQDVAFHVNGHPVSRETVEGQHRKTGYHSADREGDFEALVTKQLLIKEAQRLGLDRKKDFRMALKNYYEQSLINVLTDHTIASMEVKISEQDIDQYLASSGSIFTFTQIPLEKGEPIDEQSQQNSVLFDDLSESLRLLLATMQVGEQVGQFETGTEVSLIRLDKIERDDAFEPVAYDRDRIRDQLENYRKSMEMERWINGLRSRASIIVSDGVKRNDEKQL